MQVEKKSIDRYSLVRIKDNMDFNKKPLWYYLKFVSENSLDYEQTPTLKYCKLTWESISFLLFLWKILIKYRIK